MTLSLQSGPLRTRDGHDLRLRCQAPVRLHDAEVDRTAFADRFLRTRVTATSDDVADVLAREMAPAFEVAAKSHDAATLLDDPPTGILASLDAAARRAGFGIGLEITGPLTLTAESPSLARRRVEEAAEAARLASAEHEGDLLRRFGDIRRHNPAVPAGAMLMGIAEPQRRDVLLALLKAGGNVRHAPLFVVAGEGLFRIDIEADEVEPLRLPGELGPIRSIRAIRRASKPALLVGARDGVYLVDPASPQSAEAFVADVPDSAHGFSHLGFDGSNDVICARHTHVGFVSWQVGLGTRVIYSGEDFASGDPSAVAAADGQVFVAAGSAVYTVIPGAPPEQLFDRGAGRAVFLRVIGPDLVVAWEDGAVTHQRIVAGRDEQAGEGPAHLLPFEPCALGALPWLGDERLILGGSGKGELAILGIHDDVRLPLESESGPVKAVAASAGVIAGISEDRQRLLAWRAWEQKPYRDLHLISRLRGRAADLAFLSETDAGITVTVPGMGGSGGMGLP